MFSGQSLPPAGLEGKRRGLERLRANSVLAEACLRSSFSCLPCRLPAVLSAALGSKACEGGAGLALNEGTGVKEPGRRPRPPAEAYPNGPQS